MKKGPVFIEKKYFKHFSGHLYFILVAKGSFMHVPLSVNWVAEFIKIQASI